MGTLQTQEFTASGTHTVATGVSAVWVDGVAGGGAGGTRVLGSINAAGGGGAGEACEGIFLKVTSGGTVTVTVGAGGTQVNPASVGTNVQIGPEGNTGGGGSGNGGADTTIAGPTLTIRLKGGYGGATGSSPHGGMGGGVAAGATGGNGGLTNTNAGNYAGAVGNGTTAQRKCNDARFWAGSGGGSGGANSGTPETGGVGGSCGPWSGGAGGVASTTLNGGGGGGASVYGPGGAGGAADTDAPAIPAGAYGAGGGGGGGDSRVQVGLNPGRLGRAGANGYVRISWFA